ncbi:hypothetical protein GF325_06965 [Candidatus Bathyarchaeota archaeon]|nr:hypothetical protein [Candidatus Bathyarchaeota archaeon]
MLRKDIKQGRTGTCWFAVFTCLDFVIFSAMFLTIPAISYLFLLPVEDGREYILMMMIAINIASAPMITINFMIEKMSSRSMHYIPAVSVAVMIACMICPALAPAGDASASIEPLFLIFCTLLVIGLTCLGGFAFTQKKIIRTLLANGDDSGPTTLSTMVAIMALNGCLVLTWQFPILVFPITGIVAGASIGLGVFINRFIERKMHTDPTPVIEYMRNGSNYLISDEFYYILMLFMHALLIAFLVNWFASPTMNARFTSLLLAGDSPGTDPTLFVPFLSVSFISGSIVITFVALMKKLVKREKIRNLSILAAMILLISAFVMEISPIPAGWKDTSIALYTVVQRVMQAAGLLHVFLTLLYLDGSKQLKSHQVIITLNISAIALQVSSIYSDLYSFSISLAIITPILTFMVIRSFLFVLKPSWSINKTRRSSR